MGNRIVSIISTDAPSYGGGSSNVDETNSTDDSPSVFMSSPVKKTDSSSSESSTQFSSQNSDLQSWNNMFTQFNVFNSYLNHKVSPQVRNEIEQTLRNPDGKPLFVNRAGSAVLKDVNGNTITYNEQLGNAFSNIAYTNGEALGRLRDPRHPLCLMGVRKALETANLTNGESLGGSACDAPKKLMESPEFKRNYAEVRVSNADLESFLAKYKGAIVVWPQYHGRPTANYPDGFHRDGHITTILGVDENGNLMEASDKVNKFYNMLNSDPSATPRIFIPVSANK